MKTPHKIYAIQIKIKNVWEFGPRFYGLDVASGLVGSYFMSTYELVNQERLELCRREHIALEKTRIIIYELEKIFHE